MIDINWIHLVFALLLGFLFKVLFDELKSPRIRIICASRNAFTISPEIRVICEGIDNDYTAYRIRVENKQKRYLHSAAENCMAWIELDSAPESYQICWVGSCPEVTINVGDIREVDFCARGNATGRIYAPTERGYFEPSPRLIGDGKSEIRGKLRITSKNGRKEEKRFVIRPSNSQLVVSILNAKDRKEHMVNSNESRDDISNQIKKSERSAWFRFFLSLGFATIAMGLAIAFSSTEAIQNPLKSILAASLLVLGFVIMFQSGPRYYPQWFHKRIADIGIAVLLVGVIALMVGGILKTEYSITIAHLVPCSILVCLVGFFVTVVSLFRFSK